MKYYLLLRQFLYYFASVLVQLFFAGVENSDVFFFICFILCVSIALSYILLNSVLNTILGNQVFWVLLINILLTLKPCNLYVSLFLAHITTLYYWPSRYSPYPSAVSLAGLQSSLHLRLIPALETSIRTSPLISVILPTLSSRRSSSPSVSSFLLYLQPS